MDKADAVVATAADYWFRWQVLVCAFIFLIPTMVSVILIRRRRRRQLVQLQGLRTNSFLNSADLWVPCWRTLHPSCLLYYRAFAFLTMTFLLYQTVQAFGFFVFFFYTQWTFALVVIYFAFATIISAQACWMNSTKLVANSGENDKFLKKHSEDTSNDQFVTSSKEKQDGSFGKHQGPQSQVPIDQQAGFWGNLMQSIYQTCAGAVMLTDIVFWCLLLPFMSGEHFQLTLLIACMHSVNAIFLILDSALNSIPFSWFGIVYFVLWSSSYVVFQWALHACCFTWWPYPFLDLSNAWAPMWYFALALVHIPCYGLYVLLVKAKESIFSRMFSRAYLRISAEKKQT